MDDQNSSSLVTGTPTMSNTTSNRRVRGRNTGSSPLLLQADHRGSICGIRNDPVKQRVLVNLPTKTLLPTQAITAFKNMTRQAMETLIRVHGFSRKRAQIALLDQLILFRQGQRDMSLYPIPPISDIEIFNCMRSHKIGMEEANIALTIEQAISSILREEVANPSSIKDVLDAWTSCLKNAQPIQLRQIIFPTEPSSFLLPARKTIPSSPAVQYGYTATPPLSTKPPSLALDVTGSTLPTATVNNRSKIAKKSSIHVSTPSSTTTATTTTSTHRPRVDSVSEAVSSKLTASLDSSNASTTKGKPPIAPGAFATGATNSGLNVGTLSRNNVHIGSASGSKRSNTTVCDGMLLVDPASSNRPSSPPPSSKRQRRSSGAN